MRYLPLILLFPVTPLAAADKDVEFFETKIRPVLLQHCYECHSAAAKEIQGGLRLDSRPGVRKGGETGAVVVAGKPGESLLMAALRHESIKMPPKGPLPAEVIKDFENWIRRGAADPRDRPPSAREAARLSWQVLLASRKDWWSLKPVRAGAVPEVQDADWSMKPIDGPCQSLPTKSPRLGRVIGLSFSHQPWTFREVGSPTIWPALKFSAWPGAGVSRVRFSLQWAPR